MAITNFQRLPSPNNKYEFVGPNYMQHGEVSGYVYYPWNDQYYTDPKSVEKYNEATGQAPKKTSAMDAIIPVAGTALAVEAGKGIGQGLFSNGGATTTAGATNSGGGWLSGMFGGGSQGATTAGPSVASAPSVYTTGVGGAVPAPTVGPLPQWTSTATNAGSTATAGASGGGGMFGSGVGSKTGIGGSGIGAQGGIGGWGAVGLNAYRGVKDWKDSKNFDQRGRANNVMADAGRAVAGYYTGGLSELAALGLDAIFGKGSTNKVLGKAMRYSGLGAVMPKIMGDKTKHTEYRNIAEQIKQGNISEAEGQVLMQNADKFGKGGRNKINVENHYNQSLANAKQQGMNEADALSEATRQKQYAELVKSGKDDDAINLLQGKDIIGYGNVAEALAKATGKKGTELSLDQRIKGAQAILDYDKENQNALYSSKGSYNVGMNDDLKNRINNAIAGNATPPKGMLATPPPAKNQTSNANGGNKNLAGLLAGVKAKK